MLSSRLAQMAPRPDFARSGGIWILGYGSIVERETCAKTLGYEPAERTEHRPALLRNAVRRWEACMSNIHDDPTDKHYVDGKGNRPDCGICFLGLADQSAASVNGAIIRVTEAGLAAFDDRERRYVRIEVTDRIQAEPPVGDDSVVYAYYPSASARASFEKHRSEGSAVVSNQYLNTVEGAFTKLGEGALDAFWASTELPPRRADLTVVRGQQLTTGRYTE